MSFMHGAQDGQKFIGVLFLGVAFCNGQSSVENMIIPVWLMLLCSVVMGVGTSVGGEKIIKSVGMDMVKLEKYQGFSADLSSSLCLLLATLTGIPVSTTHVKTTAIMGVGAVKRISAINFGVVKDMLLTWIFTFPGCGLISFCMAKLFLHTGDFDPLTVISWRDVYTFLEYCADSCEFVADTVESIVMKNS